MKKFWIRAVLAIAVYAAVFGLGFALNRFGTHRWWVGMNFFGVVGSVSALNVTISAIIALGMLVLAYLAGDKRRAWFVIGTTGGYILNWLILLALMPTNYIEMSDFWLAILTPIMWLGFNGWLSFETIFTPLSEAFNTTFTMSHALYSLIILAYLIGKKTPYTLLPKDKKVKT